MSLEAAIDIVLSYGSTANVYSAHRIQFLCIIYLEYGKSLITQETKTDSFVRLPRIVVQDPNFNRMHHLNQDIDESFTEPYETLVWKAWNDLNNEEVTKSNRRLFSEIHT